MFLILTFNMQKNVLKPFELVLKLATSSYLDKWLMCAIQYIQKNYLTYNSKRSDRNDFNSRC